MTNVNLAAFTTLTPIINYIFINNININFIILEHKEWSANNTRLLKSKSISANNVRCLQNNVQLLEFTFTELVKHNIQKALLRENAQDERGKIKIFKTDGWFTFIF